MQINQTLENVKYPGEKPLLLMERFNAMIDIPDRVLVNFSGIAFFNV